ncbi:MAG: phosphoesterase, family [Eubacterium sp.]|jgi:putative phosphoesterase|nr:phosphoesterase, family [Eubacterium sp.]
MITIGVIADTHIPRKGKNLPETLLRKLSGMDMIIHAGDLCRDYVIYELEEIAPVIAVLGNNDDEFLETMLPLKRMLEVEECRIGILHGHGYGSTAAENSKRAFKGEKVDCIVFGHSHIPMNKSLDGVLYFNPGSAMDKRRQKKCSFGILRVDGKSIWGEIIEIELDN